MVKKKRQVEDYSQAGWESIAQEARTAIAELIYDGKVDPFCKKLSPSFDGFTLTPHEKTVVLGYLKVPGVVSVAWPRRIARYEFERRRLMGELVLEAAGYEVIDESAFAYQRPGAYGLVEYTHDSDPSPVMAILRGEGGYLAKLGALDRDSVDLFPKPNTGIRPHGRLCEYLFEWRALYALASEREPLVEVDCRGSLQEILCVVGAVTEYDGSPIPTDKVIFPDRARWYLTGLIREVGFEEVDGVRAQSRGETEMDVHLEDGTIIKEPIPSTRDWAPVESLHGYTVETLAKVEDQTPGNIRKRLQKLALDAIKRDVVINASVKKLTRKRWWATNPLRIANLGS